MAKAYQKQYMIRRIKEAAERRIDSLPQVQRIRKAAQIQAQAIMLEDGDGMKLARYIRVLQAKR